jgi:hypothetical protein
MNGKDKAAEIMKNYKIGDKTTYINMEAIESLPDEFDVVVTEVTFNPQKIEDHFTNVGTKNSPSYYPRTELMYAIAEARGITGAGMTHTEYRKEEVDINDMLCRPIDAEPTMRMIEVAVKVTKQSKVLEPDGTHRLSSPCSNEFNYWDRARIEWTKDEEYENGRYKTPIKRKSRYLDLKKFAIQQAETKAFCKTVRELAGLPTGFRPYDLREGKFTFYKIVRSKSMIKLETAARIDSIRNGNTRQIEDAGKQVFDDFQLEAPNREGYQPTDNTKKEDIEPPKGGTGEISFVEKSYSEMPDEERKEYAVKILKAYMSGDNLEVIKKIPHAEDVIKHTIENYKKNSIAETIKIIKTIESKEGITKIDHELFDGEVF